MLKRLATLLPAVVLLGFCLASPALAGNDGIKVKLTFKNSTTQRVQVAVMYSGFDTPDDRKVGWYIIDPGASKVVTVPVHPNLTMQETGYYAQSQPGPGQATIYWRGDFKKLSVSSTKFNAPQDEDLPGGKVVGFRKITLSRPDDDNSDATALITLKE